MFSVGIGTLATLASALMRGDGNVIEKLVEHKIEEAGRELIAELIKATPIGEALETFDRLKEGADRIKEGVETGGASEIDRIRRGWLNSLRPAPIHNPMLRRLAGSFQSAMAQRNSQKRTWQHGANWAGSRAQWLAEGWQHDWRSQPRSPIGEWIPGRLTYPVTEVARPSRRKRHVLKLRRRYRAMGRQIAKSVTSSWGRE